MPKTFLDKFRLLHEKEATPAIIDSVDKGVVFRGASLWILIFAIFIASLGLNINATAVVIGAMLISPLMGPIMGIGLSIGINDLSLLRKSIYNYLVATLTALVTSTAFFLISPLNEAHSEILARTSPTIYDVLIALFGGLAGILATASKFKGNVIPGVAIATALMPPLCTAGYGLATMQLNYSIGAFYLFIINSVFIALATYITVRLLKFPYKHLPDERADRRATRIIWFVVVITLAPSIYFGYDIVQRDKFTKQANFFIDTEAKFANDYLLNRKVDAKNKIITLIYGGEEITPQQISSLKEKLKIFNLENATLEIHQGFSYLANMNQGNSDQLDNMNAVLKTKEDELHALQLKMDSSQSLQTTAARVFSELSVQYPDLLSAMMNSSQMIRRDTTAKTVLLVVLDFSKNRTAEDKAKITKWLSVRLQTSDIEVIFRK